jgi:hypothetical protein
MAENTYTIENLPIAGRTLTWAVVIARSQKEAARAAAYIDHVRALRGLSSPVALINVPQGYVEETGGRQWDAGDLSDATVADAADDVAEGCWDHWT